MERTQPLVSIVTCTYNRGHLIGETIRSVLTQNWQHFEYLIVDDGSTDNTAEVVSAFRDARIKYLPHERTGGHLSRLRNFAHRHCLGEYIAYVDSDDLWEPDKLSAQMDGLIASASAGFSFTDILTFNMKGIIQPSIYHRQASTFTGSVFRDMLANRLVICHTTLVLKKSCLDRTGPMDEHMHSGDHDLVFFLSRYFDAFVVYRPLVRVRKHEGNTTSNAALNLRLLREHHHTLRKLLAQDLITNDQFSNSLALTSYAFGRQLLAANDASSAYSYFTKSWRLRPLHVKSAVLTVYSLAKKVFA